MMHTRIISLTGVALIFLFSCKNSENVKIDTTVLNELIKENDSYSFYVPKRENDQKFPLLLLFDPQASSTNAVNKYIDLAEKHGFIIACSKLSRNGVPLENAKSDTKSILSEIKTNLPVDSTKIILAGFSGGARTVIELGKRLNEVKGIIACGATNPIDEKQGKRYALITGREDFNYLEFLDVAIPMEKEKNIWAMTSDNKHEWPSEQIMEDAFLFVTGAKEKSGKIEISEEEKSIIEQEKYERQLLAQAIRTSTLNWWKKKTDNLRKTAMEGEKLEAQSAKRLLAYSGLLSYVFTRRALQSGNNDFIVHCLNVYEYLEPQNPDMKFYKACFFAMKNEKDSALVSLNKAMELGFSNMEELESLPFLEKIRKEKEYKKILKKYELSF